MIFLGFATLMFGMETMSGAVSGLREVPAFRELFVMFENPLLQPGRPACGEFPQKGAQLPAGPALQGLAHDAHAEQEQAQAPCQCQCVKNIHTLLAISSISSSWWACPR